MLNRDTAFVKMKKDKGGAFDPIGIFDAESPTQAFNENGLAASDRPAQSHDGPGTEFFTQMRC
jgi:hypothetical protein